MRALDVIVTCLVLTACGQAPSFVNNKDSGSKTSDATVDSTQVDDEGNVVSPEGDNKPEGTIEPGTEPLPGEVTNGTTTAGETPKDGDKPTTPATIIPDAEDGDIDALHKCLSMWKNNPFNGKTVNNFRRIKASVTVGGMGNAIKDTENTAEPFLILVDAGVNVLGSPSYDLLNKNGYYCMKVNVNVMTKLTINLHCNARLADAKVNVNVLSTQNDSTSGVGVHVLSNVQVKPVKPEGDQCIR